MTTRSTAATARPTTKGRAVRTRTLLPGRAAVMDELWATQPRFRTAWRQITVLWGIVLVIDAILRIVMATRLPVDLVPGLDAALTIGTMLLLQVPTNLLLLRSGHWHRLFGRRPFRGADVTEVMEARR